MLKRNSNQTNLVLRIKHLLRELRHGQRAVLLGATRRERREAVHEEMPRHQSGHAILNFSKKIVASNLGDVLLPNQTDDNC